MAFGVGNAGNILQDFKQSINEIFGSEVFNVDNKNENSGEKGGSNLFNARVGGTVDFDARKWIGNTKTAKNIRYGFKTFTLDQIKQGSLNFNRSAKDLDKHAFFLQIPPKAIQQKELFANRISATRKGVLVETEGVVFRDIIIQGTTGVFPNNRGSSTIPQLNKDLTRSPIIPEGVSSETGKSTSGGSGISGYEEFLRLRQYFLKYARDKIDRDGNLFLIFINEKDNQALIVEPLDFTMERNSNSPMTYNYRIVLKGIGDLNALFTEQLAENQDPLSFLEQVGNISANIQAGIQQGRAVFNQSIRLLTRLSQAVDQTINGPLRQIQFATEDINEGLTTVLSLPEILVRNTNNTILNIRENINGQNFGEAQARGTPNSKISRIETESERIEASADFVQQRDVLNSIQNDTRIPIPRSFLEKSKTDIIELRDNLTDFIGLGSSFYNVLQGRVSTIQPDLLKVVSDEEFLLLGEFQNTISSLNKALATNTLFQSDAEIQFEDISQTFNNPNIPENLRAEVQKPEFVREVTIEQNDILERIAQRELGSASRWLDLVVLNNLKPPYIGEVSSEGVKAPGDKILVSTT